MRFPLKNHGRLVALLGAAVLANWPAAALRAATLILDNDQVSVTCETQGGRLLPGSLRDKKTGQIVKLGADLFTLVLTNGDVLHSGQFKLAGPPRIAPLPVNLNAARLAERLPGRELVADLAGPDGSLEVTWRAILRDGSRYLREQVVLRTRKSALPLKGVGMLEAPNVTAQPTGTVDGCPVADKTVYYGLEHPLSINRAEMGYVRSCPAARPLSRAKTLSVPWWWASCGPGNCGAIF